MVGHWLGGDEFERCEDLAEEKIGAELRVQSERVLTDPAETGSGGGFAFDDRGGIDADAALKGFGDRFVQLVG